MNQTPSNSQPRKLLSFREKIGYGMGAFTETTMQNTLPNFALPILTIFMAIDPRAITTVLAITRVFDALSDPLMGYVSDHTRSRWGRRKPYILFGAIGAAAVLVGVWCFPLSGWNESAYMIYFLAASTLYFAFTTIYCVPYISFGYELSDDYNERTSLMSYRSFFCSAGNIIVPWGLWLSQREIFSNELFGMRWTSALFGAFFILFALGPVLLVKRHWCEMVNPAEIRQKSSLKDIFSILTVKPFLLILLCLCLGVLALVAVGGLGTFIGIYYVCEGNKEMAFFYGGIGAIVGGIWSMLILPPINWLSERFGKRNALIGILIFSGLGALSSWFFFIPGRPLLGIIPTFFTLPGMTAIWLLLMSMTADVCEYDEYKNHQRREGIFAALFSWTGKVGITLGIFFSGFVLSWTGYNHLQETQTADTLWNLRVYFIGGIGGGMILATSSLFFYKLNEKRVNRIKRILQYRQRKTTFS